MDKKDCPFYDQELNAVIRRTDVYELSKKVQNVLEVNRFNAERMDILLKALEGLVKEQRAEQNKKRWVVALFFAALGVLAGVSVLLYTASVRLISVNETLNRIELLPRKAEQQ
jgi:EamA domain-containing membrane protein RarD